MTDKVEKPKHAFFAPSASHRWMSCPISLHLCKDIPEGKPSEYAHEGIVCHDIAATCLKDNIVVDKYLGQVVDNITITQELVDGIQMYIDEVKGIAKEIEAKGGKIEHEVDITDECWGTLDSLLWNSDLAVIIDLKMGKGVIVEAKENPQLMLYGIGGLKWLQREYDLSPQTVRLMIIQPRTVNPIRIWEINRKELIVWFQTQVQPAMKDAKNGDSKCNPGVEQCRWCPVSATCETQRNFMMIEAEGAFANFAEATREDILSVHDLAELLPKFEQIQNWMKTVQGHALTYALAGNRIPGYKVVRGRSNRKWGADESEVTKFLVDLEVEAYVKTLISPTVAEKALGKKVAQDVGLNKYITKPPGAPTLVPDSDKRPEIEDTVEQEFQEFVPDKPILVDSKDDPEEIQQMSALDRMRMADEGEEDVDSDLADMFGDQGSEVVVMDEFAMHDSEKLEKVMQEHETATGGNVVIKVEPKEVQKTPKLGTQRLEILNFGKGGVTISDAAKALGISENMVKMHLRYLNERNGYGYTIFDNGEFVITE